MSVVLRGTVEARLDSASDQNRGFVPEVDDGLERTLAAKHDAECFDQNDDITP